jgi:hypothetical protein
LSLLAHASVPLKFWDEAFSTAVFLINKLPSKVNHNETPYERLLHQQPNYSFLHTFGCACWPNLRPYNTRKLEFCSKQCVFPGYSNLHKGFKCLDPSAGRVYISHDIVFDEHVFPFAHLHPNVGARLRAELSILPDSLHNPDARFGDATCLIGVMLSLHLLIVAPALGALWMKQVKTVLHLVQIWLKTAIISCVPGLMTEPARVSRMIRLMAAC